LQESTCEWIIVPCAVVVEACFYIESSAGEHVGVGVVDVFYGWLAEDGVFVGLDGIAGRVAEGHDRAEGVVVIVIGLAFGRLDHADRLVDSRAVDVFAQKVVIAVVFGDNLGAVIYVPRAVAVDLLFTAPAVNIVFVVNLLPFGRILLRRSPRP